MTTVTSNLIYIGKFADMDTDESNFINEDGDAVAGTYSAASLSVISVDFQDDDADGVAYDDDATAMPEAVSYDVGGGALKTVLDSTSVYNATVTLGDGSTVLTPVTVVQMQNGDVFVADYFNTGALDNLSIRSITLQPSPDTFFTGFFNDSSADNTAVVCFTRNTVVTTRNGAMPIERLQIGDEVITLDHGPRPVRWIGGQFHPYPGRHAPIHIAPGALGLGRPHRPLRISPHHRVLLRNKVAERMFGGSEVLISAKALLGHPGVTQMPPDTALTYWHLAFDAHEVIEANGAWTEALYPGPMACHALPDHALEEIRTLIPGFGISSPQMPLARPCPPMRQQSKLMERLRKNKRDAISFIDGAEPRYF